MPSTPLLRPRLALTLLAAVSLAQLPSSSSAQPLPTVAELQENALPARVIVHVPQFPTDPARISQMADDAITSGNAALDRLARQDAARLTFESTLRAYDELLADVRNVGNTLSLMKDTLPDEAARKVASDMTVKLSTWLIGVEYRQDVYRAIKAFADTQPKLLGEDARLLEHVLRDYRRAGLSLPSADRERVEQMRKQLTELTTAYSNNIMAARGPLPLKPDELEGIPTSFLETPGIRQADGTCLAMMNITWHWEAVIQNATSADVRRRAAALRYSLAREVNVPLMKQLVDVRTELAHTLGYPTWADYQTEPRMAGSAASAIKFEEELVAGLQGKYEAELKTLTALKARDTKDADASLEISDLPYYTEKLSRERYAVDSEQLRVFFSYDATLSGMLRLYETLFGLRFIELQPEAAWAAGVTLHAVKDAATQELLGLFYLDMFPREGKYNHFACFPIEEGRRQADGAQVVPWASLVCNFPPAGKDTPSLLRHDHVETLFHEFGHVMHHILGRSKHARFYSFNVEQDFVEAPSQMLENWIWDKAVLDTFAADYRDPSKKVPAEVIQSMNEARIATSGLSYRRQLAFGLLDLALHTQRETRQTMDVVNVTNRELSRVYYAPPEDSAFVAFFGHLAGGYDAGYYGYLWSLAIAQDLASAFHQAPKGLLDPTVGRRLRDEIYGVGASRAASVSVEEFLGRKQSIGPFLEYVGAKAGN